MTDRSRTRRAGLLIPLFSCPSETSWGTGEIGDIEPMTKWLADAGLRVLQLLPINEMAPGQQSPYSAISAMAIDPVFITMRDVPEVQALGGDTLADAAALQAVRRAALVEHEKVRALKIPALRAAFRRFTEAEWCRGTERAQALKRFLGEQAWWIEDYGLFRALHAREGERPWSEWPAALQRREPAAIADARRELADEILFHQYLQWTAAAQWAAARQRTHGVQLFGDLPFMVDGDSADVWARQHQFMLDVSLGAPPDAFSAKGQNWGMPVYRWNVVAADDFRWLRERARRSADLYDGYRVDHLVGFYRTYGRPRDGRKPFFTPAEEPAQLALGEKVLAIFRDTGAEIIAEDLGTVPDFVRASLARLAVPGFRVFRWERDWHDEEKPFRDPSEYPAISVAASGTHDTEPLIVWWETAEREEQELVDAVPTIQRVTNGRGVLDRPYDPDVHDALVEALFASGSNLLLIPVGDAFGWSDRINQPAQVSDKNWTFRLPWSCDRMDDVPEAHGLQQKLRQWAERHRR
jgi:4-alpha-glucanotransferase